MSSNSSSGPPNGGTLSAGRVAVFGLLLVVDAVLAAVMLITDKNLQTNFGAQSPYYLHWYGVLAMAVLDLVLGLAVLASSSESTMRTRSHSMRRRVVVGGLAWSVLVLIATLGIVATYGQVGFASADQFAHYLFGVTPYSGALSYIPWLYDLTVAMYGLTAVAGALAVRRASIVPSIASAA
jgi:hypothetical protein